MVAALANLGSAVRVPTLGELYGQSPTLGGNPLLKPERGTTLDAGVRASGPLGPFAAELDAFGFARAVDDLVAYRRANFVAARPYNVASATVRGAELGVALALPRRLRMSEALTLLDARDDATALPLPLRPRLVSASRITLSFGEAMGLEGADMGLTLIRQSSRYVDPAALTVLPHQTHLDADVSLSVDAGGVGAMDAGHVRYVILYDEYVLGRPNNQIMTRYSISESTFHRYRREAIRALASELARDEESLPPEQATSQP